MSQAATSTRSAAMSQRMRAALHRHVGSAQAHTRSFGYAPWLYPLKGIYYFARHPFLYPVLRARLIPCFFLSAFVFSMLFLWTYIPQVLFLTIFHGRAGAWLNATFLVLGESAAITALLFEAFLVDESLVDVFDAVLVNEGHETLIAPMRPVEPVESGLDARLRLGKPTHVSAYSPFSLRQIIEFIVLLPLNFVPWLGVPLFLWLTGYRAGPLQHWRFFKLRGFTKSDRNAYIKSKRLQYTSFGAVALLLQLIPVLSMFFLLTTAAGSALWAAKMEDQRRSEAPVSSTGAPAAQADYDDAPPPPYSEPYEDDVV